MDKLFERNYSLELQKLRLGENTEAFEIDSSFFAEFEHALVQEGNLQVTAKVIKYNTHLDATFDFEGNIILNCDRCLEPYPHELAFERRVIYTYDEEEEFDTDEIVLVDRNDPHIFLGTDFYDFVNLEVPLRKVPDKSIHLCPPKVLEILGLNEDGTEKDPEPEEEETTDPRWAALKKLKDKE